MLSEKRVYLSHIRYVCASYHSLIHSLVSTPFLYPPISKTKQQTNSDGRHLLVEMHLLSSSSSCRTQTLQYMCLLFTFADTHSRSNFSHFVICLPCGEFAHTHIKMTFLHHRILNHHQPSIPFHSLHTIFEQISFMCTSTNNNHQQTTNKQRQTIDQQFPRGVRSHRL